MKYEGGFKQVLGLSQDFWFTECMLQQNEADNQVQYNTLRLQTKCSYFRRYELNTEVKHIETKMVVSSSYVMYLKQFSYVH
jgi:hypothetical protein